MIRRGTSMRKPAALFTAALLALSVAPGRAADTTLAAEGEVLYQSSSGLDCRGDFAIAFEVTGDDFALVQVDLLTRRSQPSFSGCGVYWTNAFSNRMPVIPDVTCENVQARPDSLSVSGNVYTITNTYELCTGGIQTQRTVITIHPFAVEFVQDFEDSSLPVSLHVEGTLRRIV